MREKTDKQLIESYLAGDEPALRSLFERYIKHVYNFVYRYAGSSDAEDITQDAFVSAWKNIKKFDTEKSFRTWIFVIAKNASLNWIKKKKPVLFSEFSAQGGSASGGENEYVFEETLADPAPLPDELFARAGLRKELSSALLALNPKHRMVLFLRYNDHLTFEEISESMGEPLNTVKSRHRRALIRLKDLLTGT